MKKNQLVDWLSYYSDIGIPEEVFMEYVPYIAKLLDKNVPVILELKQLSALLGKTEIYILSVVNAPHKHYRSFEIKKKSGGSRKIEAPYPALLDCQKWIYKNILSHALLHQAAHGFVEQKSILTNAKNHIGCSELLNLDLKDFFPSIGIRRVIKVFNDFGYPNIVSFYLASICCLDGKLPQGAPTSPVLSNIIAKTLDVRLSLLAKKHKLKYSRYADDMTFSGKSVPRWLSLTIDRIVVDCGFKLNTAKTRFASKNTTNKVVTGLVVKEKELVVPRKYRRKIRQEMYFIREYGLQSHLSAKKIRDPEYLNRIKGKLLFWRQVEPKSEYVTNNLNYISKL